jgi:hypothetical protein
MPSLALKPGMITAENSTRFLVIQDILYQSPAREHCCCGYGMTGDAHGIHSKALKAMALGLANVS